MFIVTDRNDKDRTDFIIATFATREEAEAFVAETGYGDIEEWNSIEDCRGE